MKTPQHVTCGVSLLCEIVGSGEGLAAVGAGVWAFLGMGPHVPKYAPEVSFGGN